jgi:hypothetical protein
MARTHPSIAVDQTRLADDRAAEIDAAYLIACREHPFDEPDEWGDHASFLAAADS